MRGREREEDIGEPDGEQEQGYQGKGVRIGRRFRCCRGRIRFAGVVKQNEDNVETSDREVISQVV